MIINELSSIYTADSDPNTPILHSSSAVAWRNACLWEVAVLLELGRWNVAIPFEAWLKAACHPRTVEILPIALLSIPPSLPSPLLHSYCV